MKKYTYTDNLGNQTEITFDDLEVELLDKCDHSAFYKCTGYDKLGRQYEATVEKCCDEYCDITDIERVSYMWHDKKPYQARVRLKAIKFWQDVVNGVIEPKKPMAYYKNKLAWYTKVDIDYLKKLTS